MYYIDTSVLVAYYCPETLSEQVQSFLGVQLKPAVSDLTEVELFSAVARKVRMGDLSPSDGNRILSKFLSHLDGERLRSSISNPNTGGLPGDGSVFSIPL